MLNTIATPMTRNNKHNEAEKAISLMVDDMTSMWDGFACGGEMVKGTFGYMVLFTINGETESAGLYHLNGEYICMANMYDGESYEVTGSQGNTYASNENFEMVLVS